MGLCPSSRRHLSISIPSGFHKSLLSTGTKQLASRFNLTYRYIDDVLSINNPGFENYLGRMYLAKLEIKDTTLSTTSASYLDLLLSMRDCRLLIKDRFGTGKMTVPSPNWWLAYAPIVETSSPDSTQI